MQASSAGRLSGAGIPACGFPSTPGARLPHPLPEGWPCPLQRGPLTKRQTPDTKTPARSKSALLRTLLTQFSAVLESARSLFRKKFPPVLHTAGQAGQPAARVSPTQQGSQSATTDREELQAQLQAQVQETLPNLLPTVLPTTLKDLLANPASNPELTRALRAALLGPILPLIGGTPSGTQNYIFKFHAAGHDLVNFWCDLADGEEAVAYPAH